MVFRCKMCGGKLEPTEKASVMYCPYCTNEQTIPIINTDKRQNLYDRAETKRRAFDFDGAAALYEELLSLDNYDSEAYWCNLLCQYGITYVVDPATGKHMPTVNRIQYQSVLANENYKKAIEYADENRRRIYRQQATELADVQKRLLSVAQNEEPFDIFICFKETDENGNRTPDSVLAQEIYGELTKMGYKVFFSRITLESKLGTDYEPYIFAALNSAKVMVVVTTKEEYVNAPWVKNEWQRYLKLMGSGDGKKRTLIPAYRDISPYSLPTEILHFQSLNMANLGFMQDLTHGIEKLVPLQKRPAQAAENSPEAIALERAAIAISVSNWQEAVSFANSVLNINPHNATAYFYKLLADCRISNAQMLKHVTPDITTNPNFKAAMQFGDEGIKRILSEGAAAQKANQTNTPFAAKTQQPYMQTPPRKANAKPQPKQPNMQTPPQKANAKPPVKAVLYAGRTHAARRLPQAAYVATVKVLYSFVAQTVCMALEFAALLTFDKSDLFPYANLSHALAFTVMLAMLIYSFIKFKKCSTVTTPENAKSVYGVKWKMWLAALIILIWGSSDSTYIAFAGLTTFIYCIIDAVRLSKVKKIIKANANKN